MELQGYCRIKNDADCKRAMLKPEDWQGEDCGVMEFNKEGDVLAIHPNGQGMGMFDKKDILRSFRCGESCGVITPPKIDLMEQMMYVSKAQTRKGGYPPIVRHMVIQASFHRGEFNDSFLWQKQ